MAHALRDRTSTTIALPLAALLAVVAERPEEAAMLLGAGREKVGDSIDPGAGIMIASKPGAAVAAGQPILELRYNDGRRGAADPRSHKVEPGAYGASGA